MYSCSFSDMDYWKTFLCLLIWPLGTLYETTIATATKTSKSNWFNQQNNNSARESRFSVNLFAVSAQLRLEMTKF